MDSRISKTSEKYRDLQTKYEDFKSKGLDENTIRVKLGLNSVQFHTFKNREETSGAHTWNPEEVEELFTLYTIHGTRWAPIRDALSEKFGCSLTKEQVKNKFYAIRNKPEYQERLQAEGMPEIKRGRRPREDSQQSQKRQPPVSETPTPQNILGPLDPLGDIPEPPRPPQYGATSASLDPMGPESDIGLSSFPEDPVECPSSVLGQQTVRFSWLSTGYMSRVRDSFRHGIDSSSDSDAENVC